MKNTLPIEFITLTKENNLFNYNRFLNSFEEQIPVSIRLNIKKNNGFISNNIDKVLWSDFGYYLQERPEFIIDPAWHSGNYYVQEAGSMFIEEIFKQLGVLSKSLKVLDLAAAPGGKSTHILSLISDDSILVSNEVIPKRASILEENLIRWGADNFILTNNKPSDFNNFSDEFDVIIVDAPCSGEGMFRKDKNSISEWSVENVENCQVRQGQILEEISHSLKENGFLIYSTCTFNTKENEEVIDNFLKNHNYELIDITLSKYDNIIKNKGTIRFVPGNTKSEGFTVTVLKKKYRDTPNIKKYKLIEETQNPFLDLVKENKEYLKFYKLDNEIFLFSKFYKQFLEKVNEELNIVTFGNKIAKLISKDKSANKLVYTPEHNLATAINIEKLKKYELSDEETLKYLKGEVLRINLQEIGHYFVCYKSFTIGIINNLQNRANNLYPDKFRIKKQVSFYEPIKSVLQSKED